MWAATDVFVQREAAVRGYTAPTNVTEGNTERVISEQGLAELFSHLAGSGYTLIGPREVDSAIRYAPITTVEDLPRGVTETQHAGSYRLHRTKERSLFRFASTSHSLKPFFHPAETRLFSIRKSVTGPELKCAPEPRQKLALIGVRGCDIAALGVLDGVLAREPYPDSGYVARRQDVVIVAVNCAVVGGTCFCHSQGTGPRVTRDYDLALTEISTETGAEFVVQAGSATGKQLLELLNSSAVSAEDRARADTVLEFCQAELERTAPDLSQVRLALQANPEHPSWQAVADRCLACGNCTAVCPTCFCTDRVEQPDEEGLSGQSEVWDSCFTRDFSYLHGGSVRESTRSRYRQWLTHKFSTWFDQFGTSGCVGCGRCITWCPVGIDVRQELAAICATTTSTTGANPKLTAGEPEG
jgi:sulfhydrogenase subunit beta (sulfur reductase)